VHHFKFLNSVLTQNLKIRSSFFIIFISIFLKISNSPTGLPKIGETGLDWFLLFWPVFQSMAATSWAIVATDGQ
jgi:hypothetical protein